jgi:hypothetical protein
VFGASDGEMGGIWCWEFVIPLSMELIQCDDQLWS